MTKGWYKVAPYSMLHYFDVQGNSLCGIKGRAQSDLQRISQGIGQRCEYCQNQIGVMHKTISKFRGER